MSGDLHTAARKAALASLWHRRKVWPLLEVYLDRDQFSDIQRFMEGGDAEKGVLPSAAWVDDISRQRGKSWKWCTFSVVWCHCHPGQLGKYAAQLGVSVRGIIAPTIATLVQDMPEAFRPSEDKTDHVWRFPQQQGKPRSELKAAGVNLGHHDDLRGPRSHFVVQDECAFYDAFDKVQEVLLPQLSTTGGPSIYATTPPDSPSHPYEQVMQAAKARGRCTHRTIYGHPRMTPERIEEYLNEQASLRGQTLEAFKRTTYFRREFLCMHVVEATRAVCPEWSEAAGPEHAEGTTLGDVYSREMARPLFYDAYDALDVGGTRDPSAWVGGFWDWSNARLVIEAESPPLYQARPEAVAETVKARRRALWPANARPPSPESRLSPDGTYWLPHHSVGDGAGFGAEKLQDMSQEGVDFAHAAKPNLESRVNAVRTLVAQGKLYVHPSCVNLRRQLATGLWADKVTKADFERTQTDHLDHFAALVDLVHAVDRQHCPIPRDYGQTHDHENWRPIGQRGTVHELDKALGGGFGE